MKSVSATDEARCDSIHEPSGFAKTACQRDGHVDRAVPGWSAWIRGTQESGQTGHQRGHQYEAGLNAAQGVFPLV